jgi:hypothetical protein
MAARPCLNEACGYIGPVSRRGLCPTHERAFQARRNKQRTHYRGDYPQRAATVRANATVCWLCGEGPRTGDPWQADHVTPGSPNSELRAAHESCNARRGNRPPP